MTTTTWCLPNLSTVVAGVFAVVQCSITIAGDFGYNKISDRWPPAVTCYDCTTMTNPTLCSDPFNRSLTSVPTITCDEACTKWVHKPGTGDNHIVRTCSSKLNIRMSYSLVCMSEASPNSGALCFCRHDHCNAGLSILLDLSAAALCAFAVVLLYYFKYQLSAQI